MNNDFLEYYGEHQISPVKQDISDLEIHYNRRKKLYRQCGIPTIAFRNAKILEVGPGGGYNTLAFFHWESQHVDLVEPNVWGRKDMETHFARRSIPMDKYNVFPCKIEDYVTDKKYDFIIAEGFLQNLYNQQEVIDKLQNLVDESGVIVITCTDAVCYFVELMKRLVGWAFVADITDYKDRVEYLAGLFAPQLAKLEGVSRSAEEWVQDQILDTPNVNGMELSLLQAMDYFLENFDILGGSPRMFTDYSWYKDIGYDNRKDYEEQFRRKRMSLLMANMPETILTVEQADILTGCFDRIKGLEVQYEHTYDKEIISNIIREMDSVKGVLEVGLSNEFMQVFEEIREVLTRILKSKTIRMENYPHFFAAFGRTQQYISFVKK